MANNELRRLLLLEEVAEALRLSPRSVQRLVRNEQLAAVQLGRSLRFDPNDVAQFIQRNRKRKLI